MKKYTQLLTFFVFMACAYAATARGVYQKQADFLSQTFTGNVPKPGLIWLTGKIRKAATQILQHKPSRLRVRYWARGMRSAWVLEEIGKEQPITLGIVINKGRIERLRVLAFRESRGDEVRHDFFTRQFSQAALKPDLQLSTSIDGISGATLSVRALQKLARLALYLDQQRQSRD
ncbi:MAG TPA: FMN-binding protein [Gammaproteobacteria bacterium]|nr:FMN-binding protein [Gammaproteobacteria bacterium]